MRKSMKIALLFASAALVAAPAMAQDEPPPVEVDIVGGGVADLTAIAVPALPVAGGASSTLGRQIAEVIASDLRSTGLFTPLGPNGVPSYTFSQAGSPAYGEWRNAGDAQLVTGTV
jgi:TolB protein